MLRPDYFGLHCKGAKCGGLLLSHNYLLIFCDTDYHGLTFKCFYMQLAMKQKRMP